MTFSVGYGKTWAPRNWDNRFLGPMTMKLAFMQSRNVVAARVAHQVGIPRLVETARKLNFSEEFPPYLSLSLGTTPVQPLEMAAAYNTFVNAGFYKPPFLIRRVEDREGNLLYEHRTADSQVLEPQECYLVVDMLQDAVNRGTGTLIRRRGYEGTVGGKTGTTNNFRDSWFNGITPWITASVWVGYDAGEFMYYRHSRHGVTGSSGALPVFTDFLLENYRDQDAFSPFRLPVDISFMWADPQTGKELPPDSTGNGLRFALRPIDY